MMQCLCALHTNQPNYCMYNPPILLIPRHSSIHSILFSLSQDRKLRVPTKESSGDKLLERSIEEHSPVTVASTSKAADAPSKQSLNFGTAVRYGECDMPINLCARVATPRSDGM